MPAKLQATHRGDKLPPGASPGLNTAMGARLRSELLAWYQASHRDLPWRRTRDPYAIWVSEVMLQQTQVSTVERYYDRFLGRFPTVQALAGAPLDDVLGLWAGLGYYARARKLHTAAGEVVARYGGQLPRTAEGLTELPGVGAYTAGAIASIAFGAAAPLVDGNVGRVLTRVLALRGEVPPAVHWSLAAQLVEGPDPGGFNQALMELGATVCTPRQPRCEACPWTRSCQARAQGLTEELPAPRKRATVRQVHALALVCWRGEHLLAGRRRPEGLLGGLWELPLGELDGNHAAAALHPQAISLLRVLTGLSPAGQAQHLGEVEHVFSHRRRRVQVVELAVQGRLRTPAGGAYDPLRWVTREQLQALPLSSAARATLGQVPVRAPAGVPAADPIEKGSSSPRSFRTRSRKLP
jgi:A/G-specific adenine glycosylase